MRNRSTALLLCGLSLIVAGCGQKLADKLSGTWTLTSAKCNGTTELLPPGSTDTWTFGATTSTALTSDADCTQTDSLATTYASDGKSLTFTNDTTTCSVESCLIGTGDEQTCTSAASHAIDFVYAITFSSDGKTATLVTTSINCDGTGGNDTETITATKN